MSSSNYPPGVTGNEPQIAGYDEDGEDHVYRLMSEGRCIRCESPNTSNATGETAGEAGQLTSVLECLYHIDDVLDAMQADGTADGRVFAAAMRIHVQELCERTLAELADRHPNELRALLSAPQ